MSTYTRIGWRVERSCWDTSWLLGTAAGNLDVDALTVYRLVFDLMKPHKSRHTGSSELCPDGLPREGQWSRDGEHSFQA